MRRPPGSVRPWRIDRGKPGSTADQLAREPEVPHLSPFGPRAEDVASTCRDLRHGWGCELKSVGEYDLRAAWFRSRRVTKITPGPRQERARATTSPLVLRHLGVHESRPFHV